ncbi:MAG TPA: hypothetical protein VMF13_08170 [Luteitalea sp.]|nr:hypothetical protein [Luteitalea sp.]
MSEKSVAEKARIKADATVAVVNPVVGIVESLGLPDSVRFVAVKEASLVILFVHDAADLDERMPDTVSQMAPASSLWAFFRKGSKTAGRTVNRDDVWAVAERLGMRPVGLVSVDAEWSAFRLKRSA